MKVESKYEVIIIGGGPVGLALAIELGLSGIKTLVLEKYQKPPNTPRAQSLSARTMEFFLRWGIDDKLERKRLLPENYPVCGVWCSSLTGDVYYAGCWGDNELEQSDSPKQGLRIPLWLTEEVLRERLSDFPQVDFLTNYQAQDITQIENGVVVHCLDKFDGQVKSYQSQYLACCEGAKGFTKEKLNNPVKDLSDKTKILSVSFIAKELQKTKTIEDGIFYSVSSEKISAFIWPIDLQKGFWVAQVIWEPQLAPPNETNLVTVIDQLVGRTIDKTILNYHFWEMQVSLAAKFSQHDRIFWLGDSAHAFAPAGGLGLNTGFGDAQNLGWKLAAVIKRQALTSLLATYETERRPVCLQNLNFAKRNSEGLVEIKKKFPPERNFKKFAKKNAELGNCFMKSSGLTLGYAYLDSPLTQQVENQLNITQIMKYQPKTLPGYFLPHTVMLDNKSIYCHLSPTQWNLIVCGDIRQSDRETLHKHDIYLLKMKKAYPYKFILIRPDWHISTVTNNLQDILESFKKIKILK